MSQLKVTTLANQDGSKSVPMNTVIDGSAKAWVIFNGTGTVAIGKSFNVTSITDNGTGNYTANFTNPMTDTNYAVGGSVVRTAASGLYGLAGISTGPVKTVSAFQVYTRYRDDTATDAEVISLTFFN